LLKNRGIIHHAYLLIGEKEYWRKILGQELKDFFKIAELSSSPDIWWSDYDSFGIKDSHNLIEREARRSFSGQGRFFILEISLITPEAQNALLKTLEEPANDAHFFIIARSVEIFLPTLRSRLFIISQSITERFHLSVQLRGETSQWGDKFFKLDLPERLDFIQKEFLPARAGGKNKDRSKSEIIDFVINLEKTFRQKINLKKITKDEELVLYEFEKCLRYLQNPRSSNRLILEHLALVLP